MLMLHYNCRMMKWFTPFAAFFQWVKLKPHLQNDLVFEGVVFSENNSALVRRYLQKLMTLMSLHRGRFGLPLGLLLKRL